MQTPYFEKTKVDFNNDYRYFYMDSDKYYYELSEMSNMMSNMIKEKDSRNMQYDTENSYRALGIESYMWYMGLNHREVGRLENEYNDVNTCKYAFGQRELVYSTGSSKRSRNLIVIAVGNSKDDEKLMANVHGVIGNDGRYDMKHHVGYDIVSDRVYEKFKEYERNFYGDKVYWVVGSEVGGSVANLLAKKIIDEKGRDKVFCYTFNAMNTINLNELKGEINNKKYHSIYNIDNLDDYRLQIFSRENNFRKYGITRAFYSYTPSLLFFGRCSSK